MIQVKRAYEAPEASDGFRVLVDRLWPRGVSKEKLKLDLWLKEIGPDTALRKSFHGGEISFEEFAELYQEEVKQDKDGAWTKLQEIARTHEVVTLVFGAKDTEHNQAVLLMEMLDRR